METNCEQYDIRLKSPMGWITIRAWFSMDSETAFHGEASLLGQTVQLEECERNGSSYHFKASPKLPFGVLEVSVSADIHADGSVVGMANAPRHKPMEIEGRRVQDAAEA